MRTASGLMYSEQALSRGKAARSTIRTEYPARARRAAVALPAGRPRPRERRSGWPWLGDTGHARAQPGESQPPPAAQRGAAGQRPWRRSSPHRCSAMPAHLSGTVAAPQRWTCHSLADVARRAVEAPLRSRRAWSPSPSRGNLSAFPPGAGSAFRLRGLQCRPRAGRQPLRRWYPVASLRRYCRPAPRGRLQSRRGDVRLRLPTLVAQVSAAAAANAVVTTQRPSPGSTVPTSLRPPPPLHWRRPARGRAGSPLDRVPSRGARTPAVRPGCWK